jgi:hypothetical protein
VSCQDQPTVGWAEIELPIGILMTRHSQMFVCKLYERRLVSAL